MVSVCSPEAERRPAAVPEASSQPAAAAPPPVDGTEAPTDGQRRVSQAEAGCPGSLLLMENLTGSLRQKRAAHGVSC